MSPKFRHQTVAPKIPAPCSQVNELKMSPEDNLVLLGPESWTGEICTSAMGLWTPGKEGRTPLTKAAWLGVSSQVGSPAQKGQSPKAPTTGPSAQRGRAFRQKMPMCREIFTARAIGHPVPSSWVIGIISTSQTLCPLHESSSWQHLDWSALSIAIKRASAPYHFSNELACLSGYKEICGKAGRGSSAPLWLSLQLQDGKIMSPRKKFLASRLYIHCAT